MTEPGLQIVWLFKKTIYTTLIRNKRNVHVLIHKRFKSVPKKQPKRLLIK